MPALQKQLNVTTTEKGAKAYKSTLDFNVDLFGKISASREDPDAITALYLNALKEDPETALRILFNSRDIRGGQGERKVFRHLLLNTPFLLCWLNGCHPSMLLQKLQKLLEGNLQSI